LNTRREGQVFVAAVAAATVAGGARDGETVALGHVESFEQRKGRKVPRETLQLVVGQVKEPKAPQVSKPARPARSVYSAWSAQRGGVGMGGRKRLQLVESNVEPRQRGEATDFRG
jgi:hypothetical protein